LSKLFKDDSQSESVVKIWQKACELAGGQPTREIVQNAIQAYETELATRAKREVLTVEYQTTCAMFKAAIDGLGLDKMDIQDMENHVNRLKKLYNNFINELG
jgi:hypothetical protein